MNTHLEKKIPIVAIKISLSDMKTICERLTVQMNEQAEMEIRNALKRNDQTDEDFAAFKKRAKDEAFKITTSIVGRDGQTLFGADASVFDSPNKPDKISSIYMTNITAYRNFSGVKPVCAFELNFDFSQQPLVDVSNPVSAPTRNFSNLSVEGNRESWVAAVSEAVTSILAGRRTHRGWLHKGSIYDIGVFLLGLPFGLYACWKLSNLIHNTLGRIHEFLSAVAYVYTILAVLYLYRALFGYTKWAFPTVELIDNNDAATAHRTIWSGIILALVCDIVWEILRLA